MPLVPGTRLKHFEVRGPLGSGGMGEVYRAQDLQLGREVALKVLPDAFAADPGRLARFHREAEVLAALNHPNLVQIFEAGETEGTSFLAMELLEGETLRDRMGHRPLPPRRAAELARDIALGLAAAHEKGILHRDLKPENVFLTKDGRVKLLDFGLAKTPEPEPPASGGGPGGLLSLPGLVVGTRDYLSPEQVLDLPLDGRSDLFALGVLLYEMLTGARPFPGTSAVEGMHAILHEEPRDLDPALQVPPALVQIVRRCLAKAPEGRFHSAFDLAFALDALVPTQPRGHRGRGWPWALAAATLLALLGWGLAAWPTAPAAPRRAVLALPAQVLGGGEDTAFLAEAIPDTFATRLAQLEGLDMKVPPGSPQVAKLKGDLGRLAEAYHADQLVLSTLTVSGDDLALNLKVAEAGTQRVLWAQHLEGRRADCNGLLERAAQALAAYLQPRAGDQLRLSPLAQSPEAALALQEGKFFWRRYDDTGSAEAFDRSLAAFRRAQALAPRDAQVAAEIAFLYNARHFMKRDPADTVEADAWARRSLELDPRCGLAWAVRSWNETNRATVDTDKAMAYAINAVCADPGEPRTLITLGSVAPTCGFQTATGLRAVELDPLNMLGYSWAAMGPPLLGRAEEGLPIIDRAVRLEPTPGFHTWVRFFCLFHAGRGAEAKAAQVQGWASDVMGKLLEGDPEGARELERRKAAKWRTQELGGMDWVNRVSFHAPLLVRLGMKEEADFLFRKSQAASFPPSLDFLLANPDFQALREDPDYLRSVAQSRDYARRFLAHLERARTRGELPKYLEAPLEELRRWVATAPLGPHPRN
ncbi:MAG TPA: serine/threonine-protein kinase [Holophagaceae bacterium]|nr:serine/threonine-protein kinase [Holophagaceae bacterium]